MKEQIMDKLFNNKELTSEEMIFIGRNLQDSSEGALKFDHSKEDTLESCGLVKEDFDALNNIMKLQVEEKKGDFKGSSQFIEEMEKIALSNPKFLRIILMNHIRLMFQAQHPLLSILLGGMGKH